MTRTAAEVGAGLAPARPARAIRPGERIHVVGVAGAGASAAALHAHWAGAIVTGCDPGGPSPYTPALEAEGIPLAWAHDPDHVSAEPHPDRLAVTKALTAVSPDHPELAAAHRLAIMTEPWQQVVADAAFGRTLVAIAGTHGKSTTAGWLTHILAAAGTDPSAFVGALLPGSITGAFPATARRGSGNVFVVEADEYAGNFDVFWPDLVAITNIDWDHPDVFADRAAVLSTFQDWLKRTPESTLVGNVGDSGFAELFERVRRRPGKTVRAAVVSDDVSLHEDVLLEVMGVGPDRTRVELYGVGHALSVPIELPTAGHHNVANAVMVAATARELGLNSSEIALGLTTFPGIGRRLELKGEAAGIAVYDDYGHHPTAIRATLEALRQREPGRRVWAAYEPLTYHRTAALLDAFATVLSTADGVAVADIWAGRDPDTSVASAAELAEAVRAKRPGLVAEATGSVEGTATWLADHVAPGDVVLVMGGGRSYQIGENLLETLRARLIT